MDAQTIELAPHERKVINLVQQGILQNEQCYAGLFNMQIEGGSSVRVQTAAVRRTESTFTSAAGVPLNAKVAQFESRTAQIRGVFYAPAQTISLSTKIGTKIQRLTLDPGDKFQVTDKDGKTMTKLPPMTHLEKYVTGRDHIPDKNGAVATLAGNFGRKYSVRLQLQGGSVEQNVAVVVVGGGPTAAIQDLNGDLTQLFRSSNGPDQLFYLAKLKMPKGKTIDFNWDYTLLPTYSSPIHILLVPLTREIKLDAK